MGKISNFAFYFLTFLAFFSCLLILFSKEAKFYILGAIGAFFSISGIYLIMKSPLMFVLQCLIFAVLFGGFLFYLNLKVHFNEEKFLINFSPKTFYIPVLVFLFAILCAPFLIEELKTKEVIFLSNAKLIENLLSGLDFNILLVAIGTLAALCGFYTIAFWRKNKYGK